MGSFMCFHVLFVRRAEDYSFLLSYFLFLVVKLFINVLSVFVAFICSHLQGMFARTIRLLEAGIKPV